jgi:hypothetical protein
MQIPAPALAPPLEHDAGIDPAEAVGQGVIHLYRPGLPRDDVDALGGRVRLIEVQRGRRTRSRSAKMDLLRKMESSCERPLVPSRTSSKEKEPKSNIL